MAIRLALLALTLSVGFSAGWAVQGWKLGEIISATEARAAAAREDAADLAERIEQLRDTNARSVAELEQVRNRKREIVERVVVNEVIKYVQTDDADRCGLDAAGVRIHNIAATGELPEDAGPAAEPDGTAGKVTAAEVVTVVSTNYATCHAAMDRLVSLQDWVARVVVGSENAAGPFN